MPLTRAEVKDIQSLLTKKGRKQQGRFLAEGVRLLEEAMRFGVKPDRVFLASEQLPERGRKLAARFRTAGVPCEEISARQLESICDTAAPPGIAALFAVPMVGMGELSRLKVRNVLVCENIADPGNLGTLIRSALAFGFDAVVAVGQTAEPYSPKVVRASAGAIFGLAIVTASQTEVINYASGVGDLLVAASPRGELTIAKLIAVARTRRIHLIVGAEADGISEELLKAASARVRIDHADRVESLNVAVAGSILMKEIYSACIAEQ